MKKTTISIDGNNIFIDADSLKVKDPSWIYQISPPKGFTRQEALTEIFQNGRNILDRRKRPRGTAARELRKYANGIIEKGRRLFEECENELSGSPEGDKVVVDLIYMFPAILYLPGQHKWIKDQLREIFLYHRFEVFQDLLDYRSEEKSGMKSIHNVLVRQKGERIYNTALIATIAEYKRAHTRRYKKEVEALVEEIEERTGGSWQSVVSEVTKHDSAEVRDSVICIIKEHKKDKVKKFINAVKKDPIFDLNFQNRLSKEGLTMESFRKARTRSR